MVDVEGIEKPFEFLLYGYDTIAAAYHFDFSKCRINFEELRYLKENIKRSRFAKETPVTLGDKEFLLQPSGTRSGYPLVMVDSDFRIEFGEFNRPAFYVTFRSEALWRESSGELNDKFLAWAKSVGLKLIDDLSLSRTDFAFDYHLPKLDFNDDSFVVRSKKGGNRWEKEPKKEGEKRGVKKYQTFDFGPGTNIYLRVYDKVTEIHQESHKVWFFDLWGMDKDVWRIEFQIRKEVLQKYGLRSFRDLHPYSGELLRFLAENHATLRAKKEGVDIEDCPLHPVWTDLQYRIKELLCDRANVVDRDKPLDVVKKHMADSVYGYAKRFGAIRAYEQKEACSTLEESFEYLKKEVDLIHVPITWKADVTHKTDQLRVKGELGE